MEKSYISTEELREMHAITMPTKWVHWALFAKNCDQPPIRAFIVNQSETSIKFLDNGEIWHFDRSLSYLSKKRAGLNLLPTKDALAVNYDMGFAFLIEAPSTGAGVCVGNNRALTYDYPTHKFVYAEEEALDEVYRASIALKKRGPDLLVAEIVAHQKQLNNFLTNKKQENFSEIFKF